MLPVANSNLKSHMTNEKSQSMYILYKYLQVILTYMTYFSRTLLVIFISSYCGGERIVRRTGKSRKLKIIFHLFQSHVGGNHETIKIET